MATVNFRMVDRLLGNGIRPEAAEKLAPVTPADRRTVLRHMAGELNRWMFRRFALAQVALGLGIVICLWPLAGTPRALAVAALVLVAVQLLALAPAIARLGASLDFVPRPLPPAVGRRFGLLHAAYVGSDFLKAAVLAVIAFLAGRR